MKRAIVGVSAAAAVALASLCVPQAQAHADDPCLNITDPVARQACIDQQQDPIRRYQGNCDASPFFGQEGQLCRDAWVDESANSDLVRLS
jgi:hypothetical protein